ncbi:porin [Paraburkholderia tuberum]|uniref:Outer membrane protein (Porin) n=1 Tax=Paraburkholderia tuberum TaxID=157910 RepID=A0A1H1KFS9_9BURK|nr:porin [Paraburkholderia tuberum]SDR60887.1 Outer membrane protein (porin) [Paraburkholderia tuberum]
MKKRRAVLAVSAVLSMGMAGQVQAQSSVTLYGLVRGAVDFTHFSSTATSPAQSATYMTNETSFFGFTGSEDLGGGAKAIFKLESWFSLANGALTVPGTLFPREAYVGLSSSTLGTLELGSIYTPALWISYAVDPYLRANNGAIYNLLQQVPPRNSYRGFISTQNNAIAYISPTFLDAITARAMFAPSENTGPQSQIGQMYSGSIEYNKKPLYVGASFERSWVNTSSLGTDATARSNTTITLGAAYTFPWFKLSGYLLQNQLQGFNTLKGYMVGATVPVGTSKFVTSYSSTHTVNADGTKAGVFAVGYFYPISKRTTLFTSFAQMHNGSQTAYGLWPSETIYNAKGLPAKGQNIRSVEAGIQHLF